MIVAGLAVWMHILGILPRIRMGHARRAAYALGLLAVNMVVSEVLFLRDPLYSVYVEQSDRLLGLSPTADQTRAALIMTAEQMLTLLTAAALLVWTHVTARPPSAMRAPPPPRRPRPALGRSERVAPTHRGDWSAQAGMDTPTGARDNPRGGSVGP